MEISVDIKRKLAKKFECNIELNKRVLKLKRSWDEVSVFLNAKCKKKHRL